jgi:hypothetical protein
VFKFNAYKCVFCYSAGSVNGCRFSGNVIGDTSVGKASIVQCTAAQNGLDGFSYNMRISFFELNCLAVSNRSVFPPDYYSPGTTPLTATSEQGFTTHARSTGVRIACWSFRSRGPNFQDSNAGGNTEGTRVIMLGCYGGSSSARDGNRYPCDLMVGGDDALVDPNTWVWLVGFRFFSPAGVPSLYTVNLKPFGVSTMYPYGSRIYTDGPLPGPYAPYTPSSTIIYLDH